MGTRTLQILKLKVWIGDETINIEKKRGALHKNEKGDMHKTFKREPVHPEHHAHLPTHFPEKEELAMTLI